MNVYTIDLDLDKDGFNRYTVKRNGTVFSVGSGLEEAEIAYDFGKADVVEDNADNGRYIEIIRHRGNFKSKVSVSPTRVTVKLREEDSARIKDFVKLAKKIESQVPLEESSTLRGSIQNGGSERLSLSSKSYGLTYIFKLPDGELERVRRSANKPELDEQDVE